MLVMRNPGWFTRTNARALHAYTHLIRSPDDPERSSRAARKGKETAWKASTASKMEPEWRTRIVALLEDDKPRTFNAICVELGDITADIGYATAPDKALWSLVAAGEVEHTVEAPIFFRKCTEQ